MARFSLPGARGRSVASASASEHQVSPVRSARTRSLSRDVVVASKVKEEAWSRVVEYEKSPANDLHPLSQVRQVRLQVVAPR